MVFNVGGGEGKYKCSAMWMAVPNKNCLPKMPKDSQWKYAGKWKINRNTGLRAIHLKVWQEPIIPSNFKWVTMRSNYLKENVNTHKYTWISVHTFFAVFF